MTISWVEVCFIIICFFKSNNFSRCISHEVPLEEFKSEEKHISTIDPILPIEENLTHKV
jgi:hypothetical protein